MRDLLKNTIKLWYSEPTGRTETLDSAGNKTGDYATTYSTAIEVSLSLYPSSSNIAKKLFGTDLNISYVGNSSSLVFKKDGLLFITQPSSNYYKTFDYRITAIKPSLNMINYGLAVR